MEESIIYLPAENEEKIHVSRIVYDTFLLEQKRKELEYLLEKKYQNRMQRQKILHSFQKHSYTIFLGKVEQKSYCLYNDFCFQRNWKCYRNLTFEDQEIYKRLLRGYVTLFSLDTIGFLSKEDFLDHYPLELEETVFSFQKKIADTNQFILSFKKEN